jgi:sialate O-acetylesterase
MKRPTVFAGVGSFLLFVCLFPCAADVTLPAVIGENMVLQRGVDVPVWGWADPGEEVAVAVEGQRVTTKADSNGKWMVKLRPLEAGGPFEMTVAGTNTITLSNVLVGEVWICSGQSNMEWMVQHCDNGVQEVANAYHPTIRLFSIANNAAAEPLDNCDGRWQVCRPSTVGDFSGVGYFFGREIARELDVPVGLINASWGGTPVETWTSHDAHDQEFRGIIGKWEPVLREHTVEISDYYHEMGKSMDDVYYALYAGTPLAPRVTAPDVSVKLSSVPGIPSWCYNAMIAPVVPYAIKGAIWYQGESNANRAYQYRSLFPALIKDWRRVWGQGDFPFLFVQLANFRKAMDEPKQSNWAELREAQLMTLALPKTAMAVAIDIGETDDIHPGNKQEVGRRLALGALNVAYDKELVHSGPLYDSMVIEKGRIRLRFKHTGSGLVSKGGEPLEGFAVAGKDKKFVWAESRIDEGEVEVSSRDVPNPVAVRYAWADNPVCNLYNKEGLPASPFRTDDWPGVTVDKK